MFLTRLLPLVLLYGSLSSQTSAPPKTLLLLVEGDVDRVAVTSAWRKGFPFAERRTADPVTGWVRLLDGAGAELSRVRLDLSTFNLDRGATRGKLVSIGEDQILEAHIRVLVKVPDLGDRIARVELDILEEGRARTFGTTSGVALRRLLDRAVEPAAITVKTHLSNGPVGNRYDIVILGDGYRAPELAKFQSDVDRWMTNLFAKEPFKTYKTFFNVHSVHNPSVESGADHPDANPPIYKNTVYNASYNTGGTPRCLYISNGSQARTDAARAPDVEGRIVVFVNDSRYGGCAGTFAVSYNGSSGPEVQSHEFGHSYGGVADEYDYGRSGTYSGPEPGQANITASNQCTKWALWTGFNGVGCFQGAGYYKLGLWRPKSNCLMRALGVPLCEICVEEMTKDGYQTVNPIEAPVPAGTTLQLTKPATQRFSFTNLVPPGSNPLIRWFVDNQLQQTGGASWLFQSARFASGTRVVKLEVLDRTAMVRKDPANRLVRTRTWSVLVQDGALADLRPSTLSIPMSAWSGTKVSIITDVTNGGAVAAGAFQVENFASTDSTISTSDIYLGGVGVASLAASASTRVSRSVEMPYYLDQGTCWIAAWVDRADAVKESNEANNVLVQTLSCLGPRGCATQLEYRDPLQYPHTTDVISLGAGGSAGLVLTAPCHKSNWYMVQWTCSGTSPGTRLPSGHVLPLNYDSCTALGISIVNTPVFWLFLGHIDATGHARPQLSLPPGLGLAPFNSHFAAWLATPDFSAFTGVTNPVGQTFEK